MSNKSIYRDYSPLIDILSNNLGIGSQLILTYEIYRDRNPSVVNMYFRNILESVGFDYHKKGYSPKEITHRIKNNDWDRHYCIICGGEVSQFDSVERGYKIHCGSKCAGQDPNTIKTRIKTCQEKYGTDNVFQSEKIKQSIRDDNMKKYGVELYQQTKEFADKFSVTFAKKTLKEKELIIEKRITTNQKLFGVNFPLQLLEKNQKVKETCQKRYGVDHPQQVSQFRASVGKTTKKYSFPSGNTYIVQGYEPIAIDKLLSEGYKEEDLLLRDRPTIKYFWSSIDGAGDDQWHHYHPDIIIPKENRIIEVKSQWTYDGWPGVKEKNLAKEKRCIELGYTFEFWIF